MWWIFPQITGLGMTSTSQGHSTGEKRMHRCRVNQTINRKI
ncbi:MAG: hypothetical protein IJS24_06745 [Eubacterium sp.]|nr:hypothetical protein [Eubacterium sp.]